MTNAEIVERIHREHNVRSHILRNISQSWADKSCDDLEQFIYVNLLEMNNGKLNSLYYTGDYQRYITQMIKNQRDGDSGMKYISKKNGICVSYTTSMYAKEFKLKDHAIITDYPIDVDDVWSDPRVEFIYACLSGYSYMREVSGATNYQLKLALASDLLLFYARRKMSLREVGEKFNMKRWKVAMLLKAVKDELKNKFKNEYKENDWIADDIF